MRGRSPGKPKDSAAVASLDAKFERLAFDLNDGDDGNFLSGWQCTNPFVSRFLDRVRRRAATLDHTRYSYFDAHAHVANSILEHHALTDHRRPEAVLCGCGTTSLLFTWATYLRSVGVSRVYYLPPLYISLHKALVQYGIRTISLTTKQAYETPYELDLPTEPGAILLLTDPVWYAGTTVPPAVIARISEWQLRYGAKVFIDGTLQYMPWSGLRSEATASLEPSLTFRLVCPSKQLCVHGYRFSYMLVPSTELRALSWTYTNVCGPAPADSVAFAMEAIPAIRNGGIPRKLTSRASERYRRLLQHEAIESKLAPNCGYFVFSRILAPLPSSYVQVDGTYFGQRNYPGYAKLNLLSPSLGLIDRYRRRRER